jgi:hypothetical protein
LNSLETGLFQLDFPALLRESAWGAKIRGEVIFDHVTTYGIAFTDFEARLNLSGGPGISQDYRIASTLQHTCISHWWCPTKSAKV